MRKLSRWIGVLVFVLLICMVCSSASFAFSIKDIVEEVTGVDTEEYQIIEELPVSDRNLFCLISPYSFSCGNLVPNVFKSSRRVTLLGQVSGGGSCSILPISTAYGTFFQISSPNRMSYVKNGSYYDTDTGIEPDCFISKPENFYDRKALTEYINQLF